MSGPIWMPSSRLRGVESESYETGQTDEREAIVRWLREQADRMEEEAREAALRAAASIIERGEHLKPADEGRDT
jgi:hypothetical protein